MYSPSIIGVPFPGKGVTVCRQFKADEGEERQRLSDHILISTDQQLPSTASSSSS
jgi:hypothetical protein